MLRSQLDAGNGTERYCIISKRERVSKLSDRSARTCIGGVGLCPQLVLFSALEHFCILGHENYDATQPYYPTNSYDSHTLYIHFLFLPGARRDLVWIHGRENP